MINVFGLVYAIHCTCLYLYHWYSVFTQSGDSFNHFSCSSGKILFSCFFSSFFFFFFFTINFPPTKKPSVIAQWSLIKEKQSVSYLFLLEFALCWFIDHTLFLHEKLFYSFIWRPLFIVSAYPISLAKLNKTFCCLVSLSAARTKFSIYWVSIKIYNK